MGGIFDGPILSRLFILCQVKFACQNKPNMKRCPILVKSLLELLQEGRESFFFMSVTCLIGVVGGRAVITRISDVITITISLLSVWNQRTVVKDISKTCTDKRIKNFTTLQIHIPANALVYTYSEIQGVIILCTALRAGRSRKRERHQK